MLGPNPAWKAATAIILAVFAVIILTSAPRKPANRFLALFLLLVAGNQGAETLRVLVSDPAVAITWFRVATVFAALDPLMLYYFASVHPRRNALNDSWKVGLVAAAAAALAAGAVWLTPASANTVSLSGLGIAWSAYTAVVYGIVLAHFTRCTLKDGIAPSTRVLHVALGIAAIPAISRVVDAPVHLYEHVTGTSVHLALPNLALGGLAAATIALAALLHRSASPEAKRVVIAGAAAGALFLIPLNAHRLAHVLSGIGVPDYRDALPFPAAVNTSLRLLAMGLFLSMAVVRYELLDMSLEARRRVARLLVGLAILLPGAYLVARGGVTVAGVTLDAGHILILLVVLLVSTGFRGLVDRVASRVYGVPVPGDALAGAEAYRLAVDQARREGRRLDGDPDLARLRDELGLDARVASAVERAATSTAAGPLAPGAMIAGRYEIKRFLGRGGSGRAFLAKDTLISRRVVVKEVVHDGAESGVEPPAIREARAAGAFRHANIVTVLDVIPGEGAWLIVTEHVPGGSLAARLNREGPLETSAALTVLDDVLAALEVMHAKGVVHRDVKPANVLLDAGGVAKLGDFGIARAFRGVTAEVGNPDAYAGTPAFMAPEQRRGDAPTPATDVYAVGLLARACFPEAVPGNVERVIRCALHQDARKRWQDAGAMRRALRRAAPARLTRGT